MPVIRKFNPGEQGLDLLLLHVLRQPFPILGAMMPAIGLETSKTLPELEFEKDLSADISC